MAIAKAYCVESEKIINIYEAREIFFSQEKSREKLTFLCPDPDCRRKHAPRIDGVNYTKIPGVDMIKIRPHFRANPNHKHSLNCAFVEISEAIEKLENEHKRKPRGAKKYDLIDVFTPHTETKGNEEKSNDDYSNIAFNSKQQSSDKSARINHLVEQLREQSHKSSKLDEVVTCFLDMKVNELKETPLNIPGVGKKTYRQHFKPSRFARPDGQKRIYYGIAKVSSWKGKRYYFNFNKTTVDEQYPDAEVHTFITLDQIKNFRGGKLLKIQLEKFVKDKIEICLYVFGTVKEDANQDKKLEIRFDSLHSIAFRTDEELDGL